MRRLAALALCLVLTGCSNGKGTDQLSSQPTPSTGECVPSGTGSTDLTKKPTVAVPTAPAPTETTVVDIVCGSGEPAKQGSKVEVQYLGVSYQDAKEFDSSWSRGSEPLPVTVGSGVITGFSTGITGMKVGGRREVIIPAKDGYGDQGQPPAIAGGATLVFVIDLVKIQQPASRTPCTPSGSGTTDLTKKPVPTVPKAAAPAETTVIDVVCGTGAQADEGSAVEVKYVGVLYKDGKEFDSSWSRGGTFPFTVGEGVVTGFSTGVTGMKEGGRREIIIPAKDGYGAAGQPPAIPAGSTLIFVIDLVKVS